jgi:uncharacterized membrane protein
VTTSLNPIVAVLLVTSGAWLWRRSRRRDARAVWLLAFSLPMVMFLLANSLFVQVKINWLTQAGGRGAAGGGRRAVSATVRGREPLGALLNYHRRSS